MTVVALIPARGGSKRVMRKNVRECGGHPLMAWSVRAAVEAEHVDRVYVSSEDYEIRHVGRRYGAEAIIRPPEYATDKATTESVIKHAAHVWDLNNVDWSACVLLQPTSPLRWADRVDEAVALLRTHHAVVSVSRAPHAHFRGHVVRGEWKPDYSSRPRTQDTPWYVENGAVYGFTREHWDAHGDRMFGATSAAALIMEPHESMDVDTEDDLVWAGERCWRHQLRRKPRIPWPLPEDIHSEEGAA